MKFLAGIVLWIAVLPGLAAGQDRDYLSLKWWHPLVASAGIAATFLLDQPAHDYMRDHQGATATDVADVAKTFHEAEGTLAISGAAMAVGLAARNMKIAQTGVQVLTSYALTSGMMIATKWAFGRSRPSTTPDDNTQFDWFNGTENSAFPSGAAVVTFSLATTLADAIDHPAATIVLYGGATLNAWARVYADRHWFSDVALGALYGITAAKLVNGRWRVFGLKPPTAGIDEYGRASLVWGFEW
jgi:membrane-associated phospholipid phosphatase